MQYWKISPSGNTTLLCPQGTVPPEEEATLAGRLMSEDTDVEQVGFIHFGDKAKGLLPSLRMMGGEFCVNATRAFAALLYTRYAAQPAPCVFASDNSLRTQVCVSGADAPVQVDVQPAQKGVCPQGDSLSAYNGLLVSARLAFATNPVVQRIQENIFLCTMPGICHLVFFSAVPPHPQKILDKALAHQTLAKQEAVGLLWLNAATLSLTPYVYVAKTQSFVAETACGSGTYAAALALRQRDTSVFFPIRQPSGHILSVSFSGNSPYDATLGGPVFFMEHKEV